MGTRSDDIAALKATLLGDGREATIVHFLAGRGASAHLVCAPGLIDALPDDAARAFTWSPSLDEVPDTARTVYVDDDADERALLLEAARRLPGLRVLGLRHHLAPMFATDRKPLHRVPDDFRADSLARHVIVCPARSGSTYLAQMLGQAGAGRAREHLRDSLLAAWRFPGVDHAELWRQVAGRAQQDGIFASKLIGEFLLAASGERPVAETLDVLAPPGVRVLALHRPVIDTVVSRYVASGTRVYHVRGGLSAEERARLEQRGYKAPQLRRVLEANLRENARVGEALDALPAERVLHIQYADLDAEPQAVLERACAFLGVRAHLGQLKPERLPIKLSATVDTHARLREQFLQELGAEGMDVDALTR